jgi:hypothetical protein
VVCLALVRPEGGDKGLTRTKPVRHWDVELVWVSEQTRRIPGSQYKLGALLLGMNRCCQAAQLKNSRPYHHDQGCLCKPQPCEGEARFCWNPSRITDRAAIDYLRGRV